MRILVEHWYHRTTMYTYLFAVFRVFCVTWTYQVCELTYPNQEIWRECVRVLFMGVVWELSTALKL